MCKGTVVQFTPAWSKRRKERGKNKMQRTETYWEKNLQSSEMGLLTAKVSGKQNTDSYSEAFPCRRAPQFSSQSYGVETGRGQGTWLLPSQTFYVQTSSVLTKQSDLF